MQIRQLTLKDFKNAEEETLWFDDGVNVICGENASGKTNLLECIFLFASGKSFRGCKDKDLIRFGCDGAKCELQFCSGGLDRQMEVTLIKGQKRAISVGGLRVRRLADYLGLFRAVIFTPDHLHLVKGSPDLRRRFLDLAICQSFPRYAASLQEYGRLLQQKHALLKTVSPDRNLLDVYHERMAVLAAVISINRARYVANLEATASGFLNEMSGGQERLELRYLSNAGCRSTSTAEDVRDGYRTLFASKMDLEIRRGMALVGPQKDDFSVLVNGKNARLFGSQGQQRSVVLSLKLAEGELSRRLTGEYPVFLLDDVLSELDASRRTYVLSQIEGKQVVLTGCEQELFDGFCCGNRILVADGAARNA